MKTSFKKFMSLLLILAMLSGIVGIPAYATDGSAAATTMYDGYVLADFSNLDYSTVAESGISLDANTITPSTVAYGDGQSSLRIRFCQERQEVTLKLKSADWLNFVESNPDAIVRMRLKGERSGVKVNAIYYKGNNTSPYSKKAIQLTDDWQVLGTKLSDIKNLSTGSEDTNLYLKLNYTGWGLDSQKQSYSGIYIDKIWVENPTVSAPTGNGSDDMIHNIALTDSICRNTYEFTLDNPREGGNSSSVLYTIPGPSARQENFTYSPADKEVTNAGDYRHLNFWMYSPYPQAGGMTVVVGIQQVKSIDASGKRTYENATLNSTTGLSYSYTLNITLDWTGWKLISYPLHNATAATYTVTDANGTPVTCNYVINNIKNVSSYTEIKSRQIV